MKRAMIIFALSIGISIPHSAQGQQATPQAPAPSPAPLPIAQQIHTEVRVFLANGDKITGIVKNNRFCEKPSGKDFVPANSEEKGSGLRLFFIHDTKSYVFFPSEKVLRYERVRGLTDVEFRDLARSVEDVVRRKELAEEAAKKKEQEEKDAEKAKATAKAKEDAERKAKEEALAKQKAEEAAWIALLDRFPPEVGWGEEYLEKIKRSRINGVYPNSEEAEFERQYATWKKAFDWAEAERKRQQEEEEKKTKSSSAPSNQ